MAVSIKKEKIGDLKSKILRPSLTSHYICDFTPQDTGFFDNRGVNPLKRYDRLSLACSDASLPGSSLATIDINNDFHGVSEKHAYRRLYDDRSDFTFYVDSEEYYVIRFFESWIAYCVNEQFYDDRIKGYDYTYRVNYPTNYYANNLSIVKFERDFDLTNKLEYEFIGAFPISISSMPVSYDASNLLKCTVSFSYQRYVLNLPVGSTPTSQPNPNAKGIAELKSKTVKTTSKSGGNTPLTPSIEQSILNDPRAQQFGTRNILNNKAYTLISTFNQQA